MIAGGTGITPMYQVGACLGAWSQDVGCALRRLPLAHARPGQAPPAAGSLATKPPPHACTSNLHTSSPLPAPPRCQVIKAVLKDGDDATQLSLLYANVSPDDILLREELDALAAAHPNFRVWYTGEPRGGLGMLGVPAAGAQRACGLPSPPLPLLRSPP